MQKFNPDMSVNSEEINDTKIHKNASSRDVSFDLLRIVLSLMVVILHVSAGKFLSTDIHSNQFVYATMYEVFVRCSVPVFFMISGYFTFSGEFDLKKTVKKALHFFMLYILWAFLYDLYYLWVDEKLSVMELIYSIPQVQYHLWFLSTFTYTQIVSPFVFALRDFEQKYAGKWDLFGYFVLIFFIFSIMKTSLSIFFTLNQNDFSNRVLNQYSIFYANNYLYYFIMGYYFSKKELKLFGKKLGNGALLLLFLATSCISIAFTVHYSRLFGVPKDNFFSSFQLVVFIHSILVFKFFHNLKGLQASHRLRKWILGCSKLTLGVYLIHPIFVEKAKTIELIKGLSSLYYIPLVSICIFILCACITWIGMKLPLIKRILS